MSHRRRGAGSATDWIRNPESAPTPPRLRKDVTLCDYHFGGTPVLAEWIAGGACISVLWSPGLDAKDEQ
ncbi:hypothetical protein MHEL_51060 [Mycolicibacterium helvum]|uniref:Uncharacterized protein n=1 Tax=Mycolicibacterium helvum TaxID=1534349 RepID=A0A7I7TDM7_9MYCO|nr:hypothetical protein MHEL_51060 [Mycolicibacterium helvum]